ncbi:hypothetical protein LSTR_LSTR012586 [Laodelphax striatellus]|uniref:Uncharacterized protein n=1 Tax=Laodelphax striatellus TaxID=195883 RepID=A0A482X9V8_LAOST|nr:hypothetical protein LSTR_LSTR012586 [Laodelphax striatellus]
MKVKEKQVIQKRQKIKNVRKSVTSTVATRKVADKPETAKATENANSTKQQECDVNSRNDAGKTGKDESSKILNKDGSTDQTAHEHDNAKELCNSLPTNSENVQPNKLEISQKSNTSTKQVCTLRNNGDDNAAISEKLSIRG